jgi:glycosyltransferase involved in cell wall biosynthesis
VNPAPNRSPERGRTVIFEPDHRGHRFYYVRLLANALLEDGRRPILVTSPDAMKSPQAAEFLAGLPEQFEVQESRAHTTGQVSSWARGIGADQIIVPDGDRHLIRTLFRVGRRLPRVTLLVMREPVCGTRRLSSAAARQWGKLASMHALRLRSSARVAVLKSSVWRGRSPFAVAQDPVTLAASAEDVVRARSAFDLDPARRWFAVVGAITERKNLPLISEAFSHAADENVGLFIGGVVDPAEMRRAHSYLAEAERQGGRVTVIDRMLSDVELDAAIGAVDCVILAHSNEGPSGIFGKAVMTGTRLIASGAVSLREDSLVTPTHATWCPLTAAALSGAIAEAARAPRPEPMPDMGSMRFTRALL